MPTRKNHGEVHAAAVDAAQNSTAAAGKIRRNLKRAARGTMLAAGLTVAQWSVEVDALEQRLFSPSALDRLKPPITRFHD